MRYCRYSSPLGEIRIASDGTAVTGLWLPGQGGEEKIAAMGLSICGNAYESDVSLFSTAMKDSYLTEISVMVK